MRVLMVTCEWPTAERPDGAPFIVQQVRFLQQAGVDVEVFAFRGARDPRRYFAAWYRLQRRIATASFDLVHGQFGQSAALACVPKRLPLVVTFRGDDLGGIVGDSGRYLVLGRVLRRVSRFAARRADACIVVADHMRAHLPRPAHLLPSGLDLDLFHPRDRATSRSELGLPADGKLVLFASDPNETRKRFTLAKRAVEMTGLATPVVAWGVPRAQMPVFMSACDAMVFTSMHEGSPNVVKEALACDLPVVSVRTGDVARWLDKVEGCVVTADDDATTIASALRAVLVSGARVPGRAAVEELDEGVLTDRLIDIYRGVLSRPHTVSAP